ncbi:hypothetical protein KEM60_03304 [Austwickia sp. TVS 96-490-7B]|uniref:type VII secretion target n=1 Tax=Austwickia sp. TVS 96-490-7B TaxID=2830843 RepID=UPI001C57E497|nr:type VII secretion target [Austwickia sp. TVS 96-490-7B]MBW3087074.1 hypothetical protein [Austwickia sp. TVS 96-490-7B]
MSNGFFVNTEHLKQSSSTIKRIADETSHSASSEAVSDVQSAMPFSLSYVAALAASAEIEMAFMAWKIQLEETSNRIDASCKNYEECDKRITEDLKSIKGGMG